jgi:hypothetical protein
MCNVKVSIDADANKGCFYCHQSLLPWGTITAVQAVNMQNFIVYNIPVTLAFTLLTMHNKFRQDVIMLRQPQLKPPISTHTHTLTVVQIMQTLCPLNRIFPFS